jgi:hypothetical protein
MAAIIFAALFAAPASASAASFFTWASDDENDYVGRGHTARVTSDQAEFLTNSHPGYVSIVVQGDGVPTYTTIFQAPRGQELQVGSYTDNFGTGDRATGDASPSLNVSGEGRGCNSAQGAFVIRDLARDASGKVTRIDVLYDQRCTEGTAHLRGQVAYGYPQGVAPENIDRFLPAPIRADTTRPALGALGLARRVFRAARSGPSASRAAKVGTRVGFTLSEPSSVTVAVQRRSTGRRLGQRCVAATRANRGRKRCTRWLTKKGAFPVAGKAGANSFRFSGRLARKRLSPGPYRLAARAKDQAGNASLLRYANFSIAH